MKKEMLGAFAFGAALLAGTALTGSVAFAGQNDDLVARLNAADQENAALRKQASDAATAKPAASPSFAASFADRMSDFMGSYAADLPVAYKAPPPREPGRLTFWGEGGAIWTGGDRIADPFTLIDFTNPFNNIAFATSSTGIGSSSINSNGIPGIFNLDPKIGWEAATGFDYKFANSPWHVSGQFRYGQGGEASGAASSAGGLDPTLLALLNSEIGRCPNRISPISFPNGSDSQITACGGSETYGVNYKETHWLSDLALGYEIAGHGPTYVQVKAGLRIEEFTATETGLVTATSFANYATPTTIFGGTPSPTNPGFSSFSISQSISENERTNFLGAGPLIGLEGSVRFMGAWSFDFKGDLAVLFGTQSDFFQGIETSRGSTILLGANNGAVDVSTDRRFVTMLSPDIQVGFGYWITPNVKLAASYRIDALIAVKNQKSANADELVMPQRYWHGPRLTLTGQFDSN